MAKGRQGKRTDPEVRAFIVDKALEGWTARATLEALEQDEKLASRAPGIRAVQGIAREVTSRDGSGRWSATQASAVELRYVLPVLADLCDAGRTCQVTVDEAALIARLRGYDEAIPSLAAWTITREILADGGTGRSTGPIEPLLAYAPWRDQGLRYTMAFLARRVETLRVIGYELGDDATSLLEAAHNVANGGTK